MVGTYVPNTATETTMTKIEALTAMIKTGGVAVTPEEV